MATSGSQRFYDYLKGLQEEFERQSNGTSTKCSSSRRFNLYLGNLKGEFELMSLEIETLREERDEYKEKVEIQRKDFQRNLVCERCSVETTSGPRIAVLSKPKTMKTTRSLLSSLFFQSKSLDKPGTSNGVDLTQETTSDHPTQHTTLIQKLHSVIAPTRPSQTVAFPSPQAFTSAVNPNADHEKHQCLIEFNNEVEKGLDVGIAHTLYHGKIICCTKFSRDGKYLAAGCYDGKAYIYNVQAGTLKCVLRNLLADKNRVTSVCFNHGGNYLVTGTWDGGLFIWKIHTKYVRNAFKGHTRSVTSLEFSPNGRLLVSASTDNTVRLWNMHDGATKCLTEENPTFLDNPCYTCAVFSPDGHYVAASHYDGVVRIWSVHTGQLTRRLVADTGWTNSVVFMPDGKGFVSGGWDSILRYWDVAPLDLTRFRGRPQTTKNSHRGASGKEPTQPGQAFVKHEDIIYCIATSPDGRWIASGSRDRRVRLWDTRSAATQCIINHGDFIWTVDFSPAGGYLASGGEDGILRLWKYSNIGYGDS